MTDILELGKLRAKELSLYTDTHSARYIYADGGAEGSSRDWYLADAIHKFLGSMTELDLTTGWTGKLAVPGYGVHGESHSTRLLAIGIHPIATESEERKLIRAGLSMMTDHGKLPERTAYEIDLWVERAKQLLERKG